MLGDVFHVLVLGVVLEVGVEAVAPARPDDIQPPGEVVIDKSEELGMSR
jgi:hypothetical protein